MSLPHAPMLHLKQRPHPTQDPFVVSSMSMETDAFLQEHRYSTEDSPEQGFDHPTWVDQKTYPLFFSCMFTFKFLIQFTSGLLELPMLRLIERTICRDHLGHVDDQEAACKVPVVQDRLTIIMGYKWAFDSLPCTSFFRIWLVTTVAEVFRSFNCFILWLSSEFTR